MPTENRSTPRKDPPLWPWLLGLALLTFAVYSNTLSFGFLENWDDPRYVSNNPWIRGFSWTNLKAVFTKEFVGNYAPLHLLSYMLDYTIWGLNPKGYHLANVLFHTINAFLVFILLLRTCQNRFASFAGALIFAVHPVQAESVAWVTERKNILGMTFMLLSFLSYQNFLNEGRRRHYWIAFSLYVAGLLTKSVLVIVPPIFFLYELLVGARRDRIKKILVRLLPFVSAALVISVLTVITQKHGAGIRELYGDGIYEHLLTTLTIHLKYLQLLLLPVNLSAAYALPIQTSLFSPPVLAAVVALGAMTGFVLRFYRDKPVICFWILFYFIALLPVSQIIPIVTQMNDRYLYYPLVGVSGIIAHALSHFMADSRRRSYGTAGLALLLIAIFAFATFDRNRVWGNAFTLWTNAVAKAPDSASAHGGLGEICMNKEMLNKAEQEFLTAIELDPQQVMLYVNISGVYYKMERWDDALVYADKALQLVADNGAVRSNLGVLLRKLGRPEEALPHLLKAAELDPQNEQMQYNLGLIYYDLSRFSESASVLEEVLNQNPGNMDALVLLSVDYTQLGQDSKTEERYYDAIQAKPGNHLLSYNLACFYATHERPDKAMLRLREALRKGMRDPDLLRKDPDLDTLKRRPDFQEILNQMLSASPGAP